MGSAVARVMTIGLAVLGASLVVVGPVSAAPVGCATIVNKSTTLTADVGPCPGDGLIIGTDGVVLDLGGHTVFGTAAMGNGSAGVRVGGRRGAVVRNGTITGFDGGVVINGGKANRVHGLNIHDNIGRLDMGGDLGDGVAIGVFAASSDNVVSDNIIVHNGPFEGVGVFGAASTGNRIDRNVISNNNVLTTRFGDLRVTEDFGINLGSGIEGSNRTTIANNNIDNNGAMGIEACSFNGNPCVTTNNVISANHLSGNGFMLPDEHQGILDGAIRMVAIAGDDSSISTKNLVQHNVVVDNAFGGLFVSSRDNRFLFNLATGNDPGENGVDDLADISEGQAPNIPPCDHNVWFANSYGTASPDCTKTGGQQLGAEPALAGIAAQSSLTDPQRAALLAPPRRGRIGP